MPLTRNGLTLDGVAFGGNALSAVQYGGVEVWSAGGGSTPSTFEFTMPSDALTLNLYLTQSAANAVTVDWGDSTQADNPSGTTPSLSHTYAAAGNYTVTVSCVSGETWYPGASTYAFTGSVQVSRKKLTRAVLGESITSLPPSNNAGSFQNENALVYVVIPDTVTSIGQNTFSSCAWLSDIYIGDGITSAFGKSAFQSAGGATGNTSVNIHLKDLVKFLQIPGQSNANTEPFGGSTKPKHLYLNGVLQTHVNIPATVLSVPLHRLAYLGSVATIEIASQSIASKAFQKSTSLEKIWIRESVESIAASSATTGPFAQCSSAMQIYCEADEAPAGWGQYWNYVGSGGAITPVWGQKTSPW